MHLDRSTLNRNQNRLWTLPSPIVTTSGLLIVPPYSERFFSLTIIYITKKQNQKEKKYSTHGQVNAHRTIIGLLNSIPSKNRRCNVTFHRFASCLNTN